MVFRSHPCGIMLPLRSNLAEIITGGFQMEYFRLDHPPDRLILCSRSNCEDIADCLEVNEDGSERFCLCCPHWQCKVRFGSGEDGAHCRTRPESIRCLRLDHRLLRPAWPPRGTVGDSRSTASVSPMFNIDQTSLLPAGYDSAC